MHEGSVRDLDNSNAVAGHRECAADAHVASRRSLPVATRWSNPWSPDGQYITIEFSKPARWLDGVPENDLFVLDVKARSLRPLSPRSSAYVGFFDAVWS